MASPRFSRKVVKMYANTVAECLPKLEVGRLLDDNDLFKPVDQDSYLRRMTPLAASFTSYSSNGNASFEC